MHLLPRSAKPVSYLGRPIIGDNVFLTLVSNGHNRQWYACAAGGRGVNELTNSHNPSRFLADSFKTRPLAILQWEVLCGSEI